MASYRKIGQVGFYCTLLLIGMQFLFETEDFQKDFQDLKQIPALANNSRVYAKSFGTILIFATLLLFFYNKKPFELLLLFILILSSITVYNPLITGFSEKSLVNISLIGVMMIQSKKHKKMDLGKKDN